MARIKHSLVFSNEKLGFHRQLPILGVFEHLCNEPNGFEKNLLFYFPIQDGVDPVRVVHGSRDLERLLREGFFG